MPFGVVLACFLLCGSLVHADENNPLCSLLETVRDTSLLISTDAHTPNGQNADILKQQVTDRLNRIASKAMQALEAPALASYKADLIRFLQDADDFAKGSIQARKVNHFRVARALLAQVQCNLHDLQGDSLGKPGQPATATSDSQRYNTATMSVRSAMRMPMLALLFSAAMLAIWMGLYVHGRVSHRRQRRARRFHCHIPVSVTFDNITQSAFLLDVSQLGAKIKADKRPAIGVNVHMKVMGLSPKCHVIWCNAPFFGVVFADAIPSDAVKQIVSYDKPTNHAVQSQPI